MAGTLKMHDLKMKDKENWGMENDGLQNDGQTPNIIPGSGKWRTGGNDRRKETL